MAESQLDRVERMLGILIEQTAPLAPGDDEKVFRAIPGKYWDGESYVDRQFSQCSPGFLRAFAKYKGACIYMARKENDPEKTKYIERDERSAKLATEWAGYLERKGVKTPTEPARQLAADPFPDF